MSTAKKKTCPSCGGSGLKEAMGYADEYGGFTKKRMVNCKTCGGRGWYTMEAGDGCCVAFLCITMGIAVGLGVSWAVIGSLVT